MDRVTHAIRCLFLTLREKLPAKLAALDATRRAEVICQPGPYTIPAAGELKLRAQTFALTAGVRTAIQVRDEINGQAPAGFIASVDDDGALVLTGTVAPAADAPSEITVKNGTANAALGLTENDSDSVVCSLSDPAVRFIGRALARDDVDKRVSPIVSVRKDGITSFDKPLNADTEQIQVQLLVVFPGPAKEITGTLEAARALAGAIYRVVEEGDGRGTYMVGRSHNTSVDGMQAVTIRPLPLTTEPLPLESTEELGRIPLAMVYPTFELEIFDQ